MSLIKCRVCKGTGYAALIADRGRPTSICGECGGSGTEETGCEECARLARERDAAQCQRYDLQQETTALRARAIAAENELAAARAHFRRACEWLGQASGMPNNVEFHPADEWHVRIMVEVNKELNHGST